MNRDPKFKKGHYVLYGNKPYKVASSKWNSYFKNYVYFLQNLVGPVPEFSLTPCDNFDHLIQLYKINKLNQQ